MKILVVRTGAKVLGGCAARHRGRALYLFILLLGLALMLGCGGGGTGTQFPSAPGGDGGNSGGGGGSSPPPPSGGTAVLVNLGEFAAVPDQIVSFQLTIGSVVLRSSSGDVQLFGSPRRVELSRLKAEPLVLGEVPQGNYRGIAVRAWEPVISFIDSSGVLHENVAASLTSDTVTNNSEFSVASIPIGINLNLGFQGNLDGGATLTPQLQISTGGSPTHDLVGRITTTDSSSFAVDINGIGWTWDPNDRFFTFATDSSTEFQDVPGLNELTAGTTVEVDAVLDSGGALRATKVQRNADANIAMVEGLTRNLALGELQMLVREVHGPDANVLPEVGKTLEVDANSSTQFLLEPDGVDLSNLDFTPTFDALTIAPGQNLRAATASPSLTTVTADQIGLAKQALDGIAGTVAAGSVSGQYAFPLDLNPDSAFAQLTGQTTLMVTLQPSTQKFLSLGFEDCVTCIAGGGVRVRGLLFFSGGQYRLVAEWLAVR